jgi:flagellar protein FliS
MFGMMRNPAQSYATVGVDVAVNSADPHKLILMLFDGAITAIAVGKMHMEGGRVAEKGINISKAISLISDGLKASLDREAGGELAERLDALYDYMAQRLLWANLKNEPGPLDEVSGLLAELREAWAQIPSHQQEAA